jgi:hypothetical protein
MQGMKLVFAAVALFAAAAGMGCSEAAGPGPANGTDAGSGAGICPNHPAACSGTCCGTLCADTKFDPKNCGTCGNACPANTGCVNGTCGCPGATGGANCPMGTGCCGAAGCKTLSTDPNNCGGCGMKCDPSLMCVNGKCVCNAAGLTCTGSQMCCNNTCQNNCTPAPVDMGGMMMMTPPPDMAVAMSNPSLPACDCRGLSSFFGNQCPLTSRCIAHNCCEENYEQSVPFIMYCEPTPTLCNESKTPQ